jgi:large conductance mechanosensitive channel
MLQEFRSFITRGNVLDLAVAVIIGAAFASIVSSLTDDLIMPVLGQVLGGLDCSSYFVRLGDIPAGYTGSPTDYAALKKAGVPLLGYGAFLTAVIKFLILAFIIFLLIRAANRAIGGRIGEPPAPAEELLLLRDIRDALQRRTPEDIQ